MTTHCTLPPVSTPLAPALLVGLVVAADELEEPVLAAFAGPRLPPWTAAGAVVLETLAAAA